MNITQDDIDIVYQAALRAKDEWMQDNCIGAMEGEEWCKEIVHAVMAEARLQIYYAWKEEGRL